MTGSHVCVKNPPSTIGYLRNQTIDGYDRIGRAYSAYRNSPLPTTEDKLLFILVYLKQYPTQTLHGQLFGLSQSNANKWIHLLHPVLQQALATAGHLPPRTASPTEAQTTTAGEASAETRPFFSTMEQNGP